MEYEVGDLVRINNKSDSEYGNIYPIVAIGENSDEIKVSCTPRRYKWYRKADLFKCNTKGEIKMKYKVGDKVRVHTIEWFEKHCEFSILPSRYLFTNGMYKYCNKYVTIISIDNENECYKIKEDNGKYYWCDWMFEVNNNINTIFNPNIVEDFAKLLGVELDEEFYDKDSGWRYKFTADSGLMVYDEKENWHVAFAYSLTAFFKTIKEGKFTKKWTPKDGDAVYYPAFYCKDFWDYKIYNNEDEHDKEMVKNRLYFKTQEEAIECAKKIIKQMKEGK